jgi:hypothetical protein
MDYQEKKQLIKQNIFTGSTWVRGFFMLMFALFHFVAKTVLYIIVIIQFGSILFFGKLNERLLSFGNSLATYIYKIWLFLTYNTDEKPFPFSDWPN